MSHWGVKTSPASPRHRPLHHDPLPTSCTPECTSCFKHCPTALPFSEGLGAALLPHPKPGWAGLEQIKQEPLDLAAPAAVVGGRHRPVFALHLAGGCGIQVFAEQYSSKFANMLFPRKIPSKSLSTHRRDHSKDSCWHGNSFLCSPEPQAPPPQLVFSAGTKGTNLISSSREGR